MDNQKNIQDNHNSNTTGNSTQNKNNLDTVDLKTKVINELKNIYDPEIPVNIYELGLIYSCEVDEANNVSITMTLTSPACPVAQTFPQTVQDKILAIPNIESVKVELTWDPPWTKEMMSEAARLEMNLF